MADDLNNKDASLFVKPTVSCTHTLDSGEVVTVKQIHTEFTYGYEYDTSRAIPKLPLVHLFKGFHIN